MSRIFFSILVLFVLSELVYFVIESLSFWTPDDIIIYYYYYLFI